MGGLRYLGLKITEFVVEDGEIRIVLQESFVPYYLDWMIPPMRGTLRLTDEGQQCCAVHFFHTDDTQVDHVGALLLGLVLKPTFVPDADTVFLDIVTSHGVVTISAHNEHNGYYAGILLHIDFVEIEEGVAQAKDDPRQTLIAALAKEKHDATS